MRKRIETQGGRNFGKTFIFAYEFFALFDFEFEIVTYYRLAGAFFESLANRRFAVMERVGDGVESYVAVNVIFKNFDYFVFQCVGIFDFRDKNLLRGRFRRFDADQFYQQFFEIIFNYLPSAYARLAFQDEFIEIRVEIGQYEGIFRFAHDRSE